MDKNKISGSSLYIHEPIADGMERRWQIKRWLYATATKYQRVEVVETSHGITLFCNGERQSSEFSQRAYHEGQVIPALISMSYLPRSAVVIGSSEGVACQILKEAGVKEIVHVDLDEECMTICSQLLPYGYSSTEVEEYKGNKEVIKIIFDDGVRFLRRAIASGVKFDLIVMDVPDLSSHNATLYSTPFYRLANEALNPGGVFITQAGNPALWRNSGLKIVKKSMECVFEAVNYFELREHDWVWLIGCSAKNQLSESEMIVRLKQLRYVPEYVDEITIKTAMTPPISIRKG